MLSKQFTLSWIATFIATMAYGFVVYGVLLSDFYLANSGDVVMRPEGTEEMQWMIFGNILMAYALVRIFAHGYENKGIGEAVRFGAIVGVLWGAVEFINYAIMPGTIIGMWVGFFANIGMFVFASIILSKVYKATS